MSKKPVLIISYYYPPLAGIGTLRTLKFAQYLPENGWTPLVLTPSKGSHVFMCDPREGDFPGVTVIRTGYFDIPRQLKKIAGLKPELPVSHQAKVFTGKPPLSSLAKKGLRLAKSVLLYPDSQIGWYRYALVEGMAAISRYKPAVIFSTSPPVTSHLVARKLKARTGIPWVAELRDLWSDNHQAGDQPKWRALMEARTERKTLSRADGIVTVSDTFAHILTTKLGPNINGWCTVIPNGFDPLDFPKNSLEKQNKFVMSHLGTLWHLSRDPSPVFKAISKLIKRGVIDPSHVELNFYGLPDDSHGELAELVESWGLSSVTNIGGTLPYRESLAMQQCSTVLLAFEILSNRGKGVIAGKIFEHLGARRPTLALVPHGGEAARLLEMTGGGKAFDPRLGEQAIEEAIADWYQEWKKTGTVAFRGNKMINELTRQAGARRLALFLDQVVAGRSKL